MNRDPVFDPGQRVPSPSGNDPVVQVIAITPSRRVCLALVFDIQLFGSVMLNQFRECPRRACPPERSRLRLRLKVWRRSRAARSLGRSHIEPTTNFLGTLRPSAAVSRHRNTQTLRPPGRTTCFKHPSWYRVLNDSSLTENTDGRLSLLEPAAKGPIQRGENETASALHLPTGAPEPFLDAPFSAGCGDRGRGTSPPSWRPRSIRVMRCKRSCLLERIAPGKRSHFSRGSFCSS